MGRMKRRNSQGQTFIEFLFVLLWAVPFFLLTIALGINLISGLEVIQLARDTASMFARNTDFTTNPSKAILDQIGNGLNLKTTDSTNSKAVIILSQLTYMDATCSAAVASGCGCGNPNQWVFTQYQILPAAMSNIATQSTYGNPAALVSSGTTIPMCTASTNGAAVATNFSARGITSWSTTGPSGYGIPSGLGVYMVEVTALGYPVPGLLASPVKLYNYAIF
jgi:hypothetical protein